jgi:antitoxin VapB
MKTASLFMSRRSQAVRLPAEFRFEGKRVFIYRDQRTGNVILSERPQIPSWQEFMALRARLSPAAEDFRADRNQGTQTRDPFADWSE